MNREITPVNLHGEIETLIRLHQHGLFNSNGYQARKRRIKDYVRENKVDMMRELEPVTYVLYRRYLE